MGQQIICSVNALCTDRQEMETASLGSAWPHGATDHLQHEYLVYRQTQTGCGNAWPHVATDQLQHECVVQTQGKREGGGNLGGTGFGIKGNTDQKVCWTPCSCVFSFKNVDMSSFAAGCSSLQCADVEQSVAQQDWK